jgi:type 1 fimbria pilin
MLIPKTMKLSDLCLLVLLLVASASAHAAATNGCSVSNSAVVNFALPTQIYLPPSLAVGQTIWTSPPASTNVPVTIICNGTATNGIMNNGPLTGPPFATSDPDIAYQIVRTDTGAPIAAYGSGGFISSLTVGPTFMFQLQLIWEGGGSPSLPQFSSATLGSWDFAKNSGQDAGSNVITFATSGAPNIRPAPCSVAVDPTVVTLPPVATSTFTAIGTTAGQTPFNVQLSCQTVGLSISVTLSTSSPQAGATGVIAPTAGTGYAQNVGVQVLTRGTSCNASGTPAAVTFGAPIGEGATPSGVCNLPFAAQYYETASPTTAGNVTATATYTLTYP